MTTETSTPVDVSVVVPVYNPGADIEPCIESLLAQTLAADRLEIIFVDDGSTDGTSERLDQLAAQEPNVRVIHEPNSGWAGRPRNVGTDAATGRYVQYVDQDDELGPQALERLVVYGTDNDADIVIGKVTSNFRPVPSELWMHDVPRASIRTHKLVTSLTPHKMFRTEFLRHADLRFPEGKRRLEDQVFMVTAYFATDAVAILGSYPCYFYNRRHDGENAGAEPVDPSGYYANLREVLEIVEANTEPGPLRDELLGRFVHLTVRRVRGVVTDPSLPPGYAETLFDEARALVLERFPPSLRDSLPLFRRQLVNAIADGDLALVRELAERASEIRAHADVTHSERTDDGWALRITAGLRDTDGTVVDITSPDASATATVFVRNPRSGVEWPISDAASHLDTEVEVLPGRLAGGRALPRGRWQLAVRVRALGLSRTARLTFQPEPQLAAVPTRHGRTVASLERGAVRVVRSHR